MGERVPDLGWRVQHQRWGRYEPGSSRTEALLDSFTHAGGATVQVNFPESFGSASFTTTMEHTAEHEVTNRFVFRGDLPWMAQPSDGVSHGWTYRYDHGSGWKLEYFSCELAVGWAFPTNPDYCWNPGG